MNEEAFARLRCEKELKIVPGASHLFEEPGTSRKSRHSRRTGFAVIRLWSRNN